MIYPPELIAKVRRVYAAALVEIASAYRIGPADVLMIVDYSEPAPTTEQENGGGPMLSAEPAAADPSTGDDMSYDVHIADQNFNYTYNVSKLFYDHMPPDPDSERGGLDTINGVTGRVAADKIAMALERIERTRHELWRNNVVGEPEFCARYDASNGWGSTLGAIMFLSMIMAAGFQNPRKKVRVS